MAENEDKDLPKVKISNGNTPTLKVEKIYPDAV